MSMQGQSERSFAKVDGPIFDGSNDPRFFTVVHFSVEGPSTFILKPSTIIQKKISRIKISVRGFSRIDSRCGVCECMNGPVPDVFFDILLFCLEFWIFWRNLRFQLLTWSHKVNAILRNIIAYFSTVTSCKLYIYYHQSRETSHYNRKSVSPHKLHINSQ